MAIGPDLSREEIIAVLRTLEQDLHGLGVVSVGLFGSRARGDNRPDSDIDLLIEHDRRRKFSLIDIATIELLVEARTGRPVHVTTVSSVPARCRQRIAAEAVPVL